MNAGCEAVASWTRFTIHEACAQGGFERGTNFIPYTNLRDEAEKYYESGARVFANGLVDFVTSNQKHIRDVYLEGF